jgi:rod shape-determining protein MreC
MIRRVLYIAIFVIVILLLPHSFTTWLRDRVDTTLGPIATKLIHQNRTLGNAWDNFQEIPHLRDDRQNLQQEVVALQQEVIQDQSIKDENNTLRKELGVTDATRTIPKVLARVILPGSDHLDPTLTIDVGSNQGIEVGQPAVYEGALIGRVSSVRDTTATVRLMTSTKSRIQAWITQNQQKGLLVGTGVGVQLTDVLQGVTIPSDGVVATSGLGGSLPQGILIGSLGPTLSKPSDLSQKFTVTLSEDPNTLESFFILKVNQAQ